MLFRFSLYGFLKNQRYFEPFLMLVLLDQGFSFFLIGLLIATRDFTVTLFEIPSGAIADSFGRRGSMIVSFVAYIISFWILGSAHNIAWFFVGMMVFGVGETFRTGTHKAMIFEWLRLQDRTHEKTKVYGFTRSWSQIGSAVSGLIAAAFVLLTGNYQYVFYFATIPYLLNVINLATYPAELNGEHAKAKNLSESMGRLKVSLVKSIAIRPLRRLMVESMGWEGVFDAVKDYLQPVLAAVAITLITTMWLEPDVGAASANPSLNEAQTSAMLIGPVYAVLFLLSAWASRHAQTWVEWSGDESTAASRLWAASVWLYFAIGIAAYFQVNLILVIGFITLSVLTNLWRPILITRFDSHSNPDEGATILSIESQSQRLATMILAPLLGQLIDLVRSQHPGSEFWPIGAVGGTIALVVWWTAKRDSSE